MAVYLHVDTSEAAGLIERVRAAHSKKEFQTVMYRAFKRTGSKVRTILAKELPTEYEVKANLVRSSVGSPRTTIGGAGVSCCIPVEGARHSIGGTFPATGGAHGWKVLKGKRYKITARITKGTRSTLPTEMNSYGGEPPFRNLSFSKVAFTRKGKERFPIMKVVGIGVPQMPMNRSQESVQDEIMETLMKRIEHEHQYLISKCR